MSRNGVKESQIIANLCGEFLEDARQRLVQMMEIRENAMRSANPEPWNSAFRGGTCLFAKATFLAAHQADNVFPMANESQQHQSDRQIGDRTRGQVLREDNRRRERAQGCQ
jgi:hypothetical protein